MTTPVDGGSIPLGYTPVSTVTDPASSAGPVDQFGKDTFLKLLVAQMKYQNPMNPTDGTQFLSQTAQFSEVEKLTDLVNQNATLLSTDAVVGVTSLLGRTVTWSATDGTDHSGVVSGAKFGTSGAVLRVGDEDVPLDLVKEVGTTGA
jgi:flagellar basal-body rod modification protein FlgD